jgi:hypothetical protein
MPIFLKFYGFFCHKVILYPKKLNLVLSFQGGAMRPILGSQKTYINDRFFYTNPMGYTHLGHSEPPNHPIREEDLEEEVSGNYERRVVGDDLGSENYGAATLRLDFIDIPYMRDIGMKTFLYGEMLLYPTVKD